MKKFALIIVFLLISAAAAYAQDAFDIPSGESAPKVLELSGSLQAGYSIFGGRKDSPLYRLQYYNQDLSDFLASYPLRFYLNGDYQTKDLGVHFKTYSEYYNDNQTGFNLFELYGSLNISDNSFLLLGKKMYNWGKGYAFNPVGYVNPKKDPENPELAQAGISSLNYEYSKSFQSSSIQNISVDLIVIPPGESLSNKTFEFENTDMAGKLYLLWRDTDIDLMYYYSKINATKIGLDFSRNLSSNVEIHGEFSHFDNQLKYIISNDTLQSENINGLSYLLGLRWLNKWNMTAILEYYHNDAGLTEQEFADYSGFLTNAADSGDSNTISNAINVNKSYFSSSYLMRDYLYAKVSWPEPFNLVDFTPAAYMIYNLTDNSFSIGIPLSYKPVTNFELVFQPTFLTGNQNTEFGNKQYQSKIEVLARFYF